MVSRITGTGVGHLVRHGRMNQHSNGDASTNAKMLLGLRQNEPERTLSYMVMTFINIINQPANSPTVSCIILLKSLGKDSQLSNHAQMAFISVKRHIFAVITWSTLSHWHHSYLPKCSCFSPRLRFPVGRSPHPCHSASTHPHSSLPGSRPMC